MLEEITTALDAFNGARLPLLIGEPYYRPPEALLSALARASEDETHRYCDPSGSPALKQKICELERIRGIEIEPANVVIGNGSKSLLFGLLGLVGAKGAAVPLPAYPAVLKQLKLLDIPCYGFATDAPRFRLSTGDLDGIPGGVSCLVLSSPSNPAGVFHDPEEMAEISGWCSRSGTTLIADEVYCDLAYGDDYQSFGCHDPSLQHSVIVRSFSKSLGICGWRIGYVIAAEETARRLAGWQATALNPPSTLIQRALEIYLPGDGGWIAEKRRYYSETAGILRDSLGKLGIPTAEPGGGFYLFCKVSHLLNAMGLENSLEFCRRLAEKAGIGTWPGEDFGLPGWLRISFGRIDPESRKSKLAEIERRFRMFINSAAAMS